MLRKSEIPLLIAVPAVLIACALAGFHQSALLSMGVALVCVAVFFAGFERSRPPLRQIMPAVVLSALGVAGRMLFAAVPSFKPVSAIVIIAGASFGKRSGFLVGAVTALVSNFLFGQGPWTAWQMYCWGLMGYLAGVLNERGLLERRAALYAFAVVMTLLFGWIMDAWYVVGFVRPVTWSALGVGLLASAVPDITHAAATVLFLLVLYEPWRKKIGRIKRKYDLAALD